MQPDSKSSANFNSSAFEISSQVSSKTEKQTGQAFNDLPDILRFQLDSPLTPRKVMVLQRTIGNQATLRFIQRELDSRKSKNEVQRAAIDVKPLSDNKKAVHSWKPQEEAGEAAGQVAQPLAEYASEAEVTTNFNKVTVEEFRKTPSLQQFVFSLAGKAVENQKSKAEALLSSNGIEKAKVGALKKRKDLRGFVKGVLEKCDQKPYNLLSQMTDMARGRFEVANGEDSRKIYKGLKPIAADYTKPRQDEKGVTTYPRYHVIVNDESGVPFEWQIGTFATTHAMEENGIKLPPNLISAAKAAGKVVHEKANLHDISYAVFGRMLKSDNLAAVRTARKFGLDTFNDRVAQTYQESGKIGETSPEFKLKVDKLLAEASGLLEELVNSGNSSIMIPFLH